MAKEIYDVVVVGAGPSGSMAALTAARGGLRVKIIEKLPQIGVPVQCAEGVFKQALEGVLKEIDHHWISKEIKRADIVFPNETKLGWRGEGYVLERRIFDRDLVIKAIRSGAEILANTKVIGLKSNEKGIIEIETNSLSKKSSVFAKIVIGADGPKSIVAKCIGLEPKQGSLIHCQQFLLQSPELNGLDCAEIWIGSEVIPGAGYSWIFPKGDDFANIGIGTFAPLSVSVLDYLKRFVVKKFSRYQIIERISGIIPGGGPIDSHTADGVMLVGDAAQTPINPITGGGITNGMKSGILAGEEAIRAISKDNTSKDGLDGYNKRISNEFGDNHRELFEKRAFLWTLTDEELNALAYSLQGEYFLVSSSSEVLRRLFWENPRILAKFAIFKTKKKL